MALYAKNNAQLGKILDACLKKARMFSVDVIKKHPHRDEASPDHAAQEQAFLAKIKPYIDHSEQIESSFENLSAERLFVKLNPSTIDLLKKAVASSSDAPFDNTVFNDKLHDVALYDALGACILETVTHEDLLIPRLSQQELLSLKKDGAL